MIIQSVEDLPAELIDAEVRGRAHQDLIALAVGRRPTKPTGQKYLPRLRSSSISDRSASSACADAFTHYIESRPAESTPNTGGIAATVVVTMTLESLLGGLEAAGILDTGEPISASQARLLAEQATIIPAVVGANSEILDLGRGRRLFTRAQRLAIALRDKTCIVEGCGRSSTGAHFHHRDPWAHGGTTSVEKGVLICPPHHTQIHNPAYGHDTLPNGKIRFHRRC